ncbi:hypothetical protein KAU11_10410 [Candidatus Babeliales bacterium]|nr:hypothetical protein [Candidatus Babeliales bacterium]
MREIKFRAWNKDGKHMIDLNKITPLALDSKLEQEGVFVPVNNSLIVMQYTGLKDKDGVEIYEGDIISYGRKGFEAIVKWSEGCCYFEWKQEKPTMTAGSPKDYYEVIGNIYENPELSTTTN